MHVFNKNTLNCAPLPKVLMTRLKKVLTYLEATQLVLLIQKLKKSKWQITGFQDAYNIVCMNGRI